MKTEKILNYQTHEEFQVEFYRENPEVLKEYLDLSIEEFKKDKNEKMLLHSLGLAIKVKGFTEVSRETGLDRSALYRAFSPKGNPRFTTILLVLEALDLDFNLVRHSKA